MRDPTGSSAEPVRWEHRWQVTASVPTIVCSVPALEWSCVWVPGLGWRAAGLKTLHLLSVLIEASQLQVSVQGGSVRWS